MRKIGWSTIVMLAVAVSASAQGTPPGQQEPLDIVLRGWEKAMTDLRSFAAVVDRTSIDKALQSKDEFKGYALFVKAANKNDGSRARLELYKASNAKIFERYICTGTFLYEYSPSTQVVRIHDMPKTNQPGGGQQESFLSFLFGMGSEQAKTRYNMQYVKSDEHYHYVRILPKLAHDKSDFAEARLSLLRSNNLPAQMWYLQPNGNEITWNFSKVQVDVQIPLTHFEAPVKDWRVERVQAKVPAAVAPNAVGKKMP